MHFRDSRYSAQRSCAVGLEVVFIYYYILVLFVPGSSAITIYCTCPVNVWLGKLTTLDMTPFGSLGRKTSTQTNEPGLLLDILQRSLLAEYFHGGEADCKELVNP